MKPYLCYSAINPLQITHKSDYKPLSNETFSILQDYFSGLFLKKISLFLSVIGKDDIGRLNLEEARDLLFQAAERNPGMLLDILMVHPPPPPVPDQPLEWCTCTHCRQMPTDEECVCCGMSAENCIARHPVSTAHTHYTMMGQILDPMSIALQRALWREVLNPEQPANQQPGRENRSSRHTAYRCYILWQYNRLGAGVRRVIPSCVVLRIRAAYPDPHGQYTGFRRNRLA
ncbi:P2X purinoceptor 7-like [Patiria miniata]|uniref:P2X purinoreceptor 7 intracellular domain-containing protein n=1 Tax=Patiria miniata TaxID=46514 RepID=A0A914BA96_PATMI|nr:P2X purinoceptor 7-like [Patiria miniata]